MPPDIVRRLEALEGEIRRVPRAADSSDSSETRQHIKEQLDRLAAYKRGDMPEEERAAYEPEYHAIERRIREIRKDRGEGGR